LLEEFAIMKGHIPCIMPGFVCQGTEEHEGLYWSQNTYPVGVVTFCAFCIYSVQNEHIFGRLYM